MPALLSSALGSAEASFPGENGKIAFVKERPGSVRHVYLINAGGSHLRRLTHSDRAEDQPSWSPDGRTIAFVRNVGGDSEIFVAHADGTHVRQLTDNRYFEYTPSFSPDGERIVYSGSEGGGADIWVMRSDGTRRRMLAPGEGAGGPVYSPSGKQVAFASHERDYADVYVVRSDGSHERRLTDSPDDDGFPSFHPSGRLIAYSRERGRPFLQRIYLMKPDGTERRPVTTGQGPSVSPDGERVAFWRAPDAISLGDIYVGRLDGRQMRRLTTDGDNWYPAWQPVAAAAAGGPTGADQSCVAQNGCINSNSNSNRR